MAGVKIVLVEINPGFSRRDIIERVLKASKNTGLPVYILIDTLESRKIVWGEPGAPREEEVYDIVNTLRILLNQCLRVYILAERAAQPLSPGELYTGSCIVMGLHTDIPRYILGILGAYDERRLSNVPYLASQCIYIIDYLYRHALSI